MRFQLGMLLWVLPMLVRFIAVSFRTNVPVLLKAVSLWEETGPSREIANLNHHKSGVFQVIWANKRLRVALMPSAIARNSHCMAVSGSDDAVVTGVGGGFDAVGGAGFVEDVADVTANGVGA